VYGQETFPNEDIPDKIVEIGDDILKETLACTICGRNYKVVKAELDFYKKQGLALPRQCWDCRYGARFQQRNPHQLRSRQCMCEEASHGHSGRCSEHFQTTFAPDRPEKIYCEECYRKEIY